MKENIDLQRLIFAHIYRVANMLQTFQDKMLTEYDLTAKQFYLMIVIGSFNEEPPTITEAAERFGSSYQNVKQMALKLQKSQYINIVKDDEDKRMKRLELSHKAEEFWKVRDNDDYSSMKELFADFKAGELEAFADYILMIEKGVEQLS